MESFQPPLALSPIVSEMDRLALLLCPAMGLRRRHMLHVLLSALHGSQLELMEMLP